MVIFYGISSQVFRADRALRFSYSGRSTPSISVYIHALVTSEAPKILLVKRAFQERAWANLRLREAMFEKLAQFKLSKYRIVPGCFEESAESRKFDCRYGGTLQQGNDCHLCPSDIMDLTTHAGEARASKGVRCK